MVKLKHRPKRNSWFAGVIAVIVYEIIADNFTDATQKKWVLANIEVFAAVSARQTCRGPAQFIERNVVDIVYTLSNIFEVSQLLESKNKGTVEERSRMNRE